MNEQYVDRWAIPPQVYVDGGVLTCEIERYCSTLDFVGFKQLKYKPADPNALLTAAQAAARLGITVEQLVAHVDDGSLRYINVGRGKKKPRYRFSESDLNDFTATRSTLEQPCPSSSRKSPRRTTGTASKLNVLSFTALRNAHLAKKPKKSKQ